MESSLSTLAVLAEVTIGFVAFSAIISANSEPTGSLSSALAPAPTTNTVLSLNTIR